MTVDEIYEKIAQNIVRNIQHDDWIKATLHIEADNNYSNFKGSYLDSGNNEHQIDVHNFDADLGFAIMELHQITTEGGNNRWNKGVFSLTADGQFDMDFIWDQALFDEIEKLAQS